MIIIDKQYFQSRKIKLGSLIVGDYLVPPEVADGVCPSRRLEPGQVVVVVALLGTAGHWADCLYRQEGWAGQYQSPVFFIPDMNKGRSGCLSQD